MDYINTSESPKHLLIGQSLQISAIKQLILTIYVQF